MTAPEPMVAFTVRLTESERKALSDLATAEHRSLGAEARRAILAHIKPPIEAEVAA